MPNTISWLNFLVVNHDAHLNLKMVPLEVFVLSSALAPLHPQLHGLRRGNEMI
jgi:hypothetical protein